MDVLSMAVEAVNQFKQYWPNIGLGQVNTLEVFDFGATKAKLNDELGRFLVAADVRLTCGYTDALLSEPVPA